MGSFRLKKFMVDVIRKYFSGQSKPQSYNYPKKSLFCEINFLPLCKFQDFRGSSRVVANRKTRPAEGLQQHKECKFSHHFESAILELGLSPGLWLRPCGVAALFNPYQNQACQKVPHCQVRSGQVLYTLYTVRSGQVLVEKMSYRSGQVKTFKK